MTPASPSGINALKYSVIKSFWRNTHRFSFKAAVYAMMHLLPEKDQKVADKFKAVSTYKEFENHAHWVIGEDGWEEIAEFISDWIDGLSK